MRIGEFSQFFEKALPKGKRILRVGPPGVGKTVEAMNVCRRLGWDYLPICTPLCDPAYLLGYPYRDNGSAGHAPFGQIAKALAATKPTLLDFDELGGASETVIKAALRLFQFGEVGTKRLPECVVLGAASNDVSHGAGVMGLFEPMKDRFASIVNIEANLEDTIVYGLARDWPADLLAFLRNDPSSLMDWKPVRSMQSGGATPRGWEDVAGWIKDGFDDSEIIAGKVGKAAATKYLAFRELMNDLPDVDAVFLNPDSAPVPENASARYLISMALSSKMNGGNFGAAVKYLARLPQMFRAFGLRDALRAEDARRKDGTLPKGWQPFTSSRDFAAWVVSKDGKEIVSAAS